MSGIKIKRDGREVLTDALWKKRRWELYVESIKGGGVCFRCGCLLDFGNVDSIRQSGGCGESNFHAHHSQGRGLGGSKRDDRIYVPGEFDKLLWDKYPYMPEPPAGMKWNLYALCNVCHQKYEHNQDFTGGVLHWSKKDAERKTEEPSGPESEDQSSLFEIISQADEYADSSASRLDAISGNQNSKRGRR